MSTLFLPKIVFLVLLCGRRAFGTKMVADWFGAGKMRAIWSDAHVVKNLRRGGCHALPNAIRRHSRVPLCATTDLRSLAPLFSTPARHCSISTSPDFYTALRWRDSYGCSVGSALSRFHHVSSGHRILVAKKSARCVSAANWRGVKCGSCGSAIFHSK